MAIGNIYEVQFGKYDIDGDGFDDTIIAKLKQTKDGSTVKSEIVSCRAWISSEKKVMDQHVLEDWYGFKIADGNINFSADYGLDKKFDGVEDRANIVFNNTGELGEIRSTETISFAAGSEANDRLSEKTVEHAKVGKTIANPFVLKNEPGKKRVEINSYFAPGPENSSVIQIQNTLVINSTMPGKKL